MTRGGYTDRSGGRSQATPRRADDRRRVAGPGPAGRGNGGGGGGRRGRWPVIAGIEVTPIRVVLAIALAGSLAYLLFAITVRDASQIPMLASGAAVLGIVFAALAVGGAIDAYRAGREGFGRRAIILAVAGGFAAMIAAGAFAAAMVLALLWSA
jgi:hypothetical protein